LLGQEVEGTVQVNPPKHDYPEQVRKQVYQALLARSKNGKLGKQDTTIVASQFGVKIRTVQRIRKLGKNQLAQNIPVVVASLKKGRCGRKATPLDLEQLCNISLKQRMTIEDVSSRLGISKSRIQRYLKKGLLRRHSNNCATFVQHFSQTKNDHRRASFSS
jgi:predicted transcriptional regulator